jgi:hypothetical protein
VKTVLITILAAVAIIAAGVFVARTLSQQTDPLATRFITQADDLIVGLQEYRKFTGSFPNGSALDIANELSGKSSKKVLVLAAKQENRNPKGEIVDPWGTPIQFFFSPNNVLIRSAGPNRALDDSSNPQADDLYRTDAR